MSAFCLPALSLSLARANAGTRTRSPLTHPPHRHSTAHRTCVQGFDARSGSRTYDIPFAHKYAVRDLDYNPNRPQFIVSSGDDRLVVSECGVCVVYVCVW